MCSYECVTCGFTSEKSSEYNRHITTKKHMTRTNAALVPVLSQMLRPIQLSLPSLPSQPSQPSQPSLPSQPPTHRLQTSLYCCKYCNKPYSARNSAWYHEKNAVYTRNNNSSSRSSSGSGSGSSSKKKTI